MLLLSYFQAHHLFGLRLCPPGLSALFPLGHFWAAAIPLPVDPRRESRRHLRGGKADSDPTADWHGHLSLALNPIHLQKGAPHSLPEGGDPIEAENTLSVLDEVNGEQQRILHVLVLDVRGW